VVDHEAFLPQQDVQTPLYGNCLPAGQGIAEAPSLMGDGFHALA